MDREIRILLVGKACSGKSSLGNLLLGEKRFNVHRNGATKESQLERSRLFDGTELVIVDTPGYENLHFSKEETDKEIMRGMGLLKPGPHFIIAVKSLMERVTGSDVEWMKQFQERYAQYMQNIIPVFTGIDALVDTEITLDKYIEDAPTELQQMLQAFGNHPPIGGRSNKDDRKLVDEIFTRINKCYKPDNYISSEVEVATPGPPGEHFAGNQKSCIMETEVNPLESTGLDQPSTQRNIILLGKSGIGKSSVGNILLDEKVFQTSLREDKGTKSCQTKSKDELTVVDTPGYFSPLRSDTDTARNIVETLQLNKLPIHVFMFVLSADTRFTGNEEESLDFIKILFGENVVHNMIIVFTGKDQLEDFDTKFKAPNCLPSGHQFLINGKKSKKEVRKQILTEIWNSRYEKAVGVPNIDDNTFSTIETTENERKKRSKQRVEELSNAYQSHFNPLSKSRTGELSPTSYQAYGITSTRPSPNSSQPQTRQK